MTQLPSTHPDAPQNHESDELKMEGSQHDDLLSGGAGLPMPENSQLWQQMPLKAPRKAGHKPELTSGEMLQEPKLVFPVKGEESSAKTGVRSSQTDPRWREGRWGRLPIRQKVIVIAAFLGFAPTLVTGLVNYSFQQEALVSEVEQSALLSGQAINDQISLFMRERYSDIQVMADSSIFAEATARLETSTEQKSAVLDKFLRTYPIYNSIAVFDLAGDAIAQSRGKVVGNHADRSYFQAAKNSGQAVISQPIISKSTGEASIYAAAPIRDEVTQEMVAIVRARIPVSYLDNLISSIAESQANPDGRRPQYDLYNAAGELFSTSRTGELGRESSGESGEDLAGETGDAPGQTLLNAAQSGAAGNLRNHRNQVIARSGGAEDAIVDVTPEAIVSLVPFRRYSDAFRADLPSLNWKTVTTVDRATLNAQQSGLALRLLMQALLAGGILSVVAALLATRTTRPLLAAVDAVKQIGQGNLNVRLPVKGEDELATLATNLNQMALQLKGFQQEQENATLRSGWLTTIATGAESMSDAEIEESFSQVVAEARRLLAVDRVLIYRLNEEGQLVVAQESVQDGWPAAVHTSLVAVKLPQRFVEAFQTRQPVAISNVATEPELSESYRDLLADLEVQAELVVPMVEDGQLSGLLVAQACDAEKTWQDSDTTFLQQLAAQIGIAQLIQQVQAGRSLAEVSAQEAQERTEELQRRVLQLLMEVDPVSQGDLTIRAKVTEDEIGTVADSYNATIESLRKIVSQVKEAVTQVASTAINSQSSVAELSVGANQQTSEITEALAKIQQMAESIRLVANNAIQAEAAVQQAAQTVQAGDAAMDKTVEGIFGLRETVGEAAKKVKRLGESSQKISKVVNLIGSFAEQTNLLALNASIEAAHAGEEGRGFAVVADEVRSLARQSAAATAEIEALVAEIQAETNQVSAAMESGTEQVVAGTQLVEDARHNLTQIAAVSEQINALVEAIAQATHQQSEASEQVSKVMTDVAGIAEQTSGSVTSVSSSFEELVAIAQSLEESVGRFKVS